MFRDEGEVEVMTFDVDDLEFGEGYREYGEDFVVEEVEIDDNKVVFVDGSGILGFSNEEFCDVRKCNGKGFNGSEFVVIVVEIFTFGDEVFHLDGDGSEKVGRSGGKIFICLDLSDSINGL